MGNNIGHSFDYSFVHTVHIWREKMEDVFFVLFHRISSQPNTQKFPVNFTYMYMYVQVKTSILGEQWTLCVMSIVTRQI